MKTCLLTHVAPLLMSDVDEEEFQYGQLITLFVGLFTVASGTAIYLAAEWLLGKLT